MTFNIANFSAHINATGTVQTNKFMVELKSPLIFGRTEISKIYHLRAKSVRIPGVNFDTQNTNRYGLGPQQKFPTNVVFSDIDITFLDTSNNALWKHFTHWMNGIFDYTGRIGGNEASYSMEYKKYYETEIKIYVYGNDGIQSNLIVLKEAFPISVNDVSLSWSENSKLYEFGVKFAYREWYYEGFTASAFLPPGNAQLGPSQSSTPIPLRTESPRPGLGVNTPVIVNGVQQGFVGLNGETVPTPVYQPGA